MHEVAIIPGIEEPALPVPDEILDGIVRAARRGARVASICTGAFVLAATGLLDGRRATTHWLATDLFRERYPAVDLDPNVLYVDSGQIITSAGATAGLDMCLHLVRRVRRAQALLETTKLSVEEVASAVGFDGPSTFRARFRRTVGVSPNAYRQMFRA